MSFNLANMSFQERAQIEAEKARLFEYWQNNLAKAKGEVARLIAEKPRRKGKWAEWVRAELDGLLAKWTDARGKDLADLNAKLKATGLPPIDAGK